MAVKRIIVLHGLYMSGFVMRPLCYQLKKAGYDILNLTYNSLSPDKGEIFQQIDAFIDGQSAALVCHSLGGLIARAYLEHQSKQSTHIEKVITLGTPHKGSHIAQHMHDKGFERLLKNSVEFLLSNNADWPFKAKLFSVAGDLPLGLMPILRKGSESDGTVLLDETRLHGMAEHQVFHLSHTSMIYSRQVLEYILNTLATKH